MSNLARFVFRPQDVVIETDMPAGESLRALEGMQFEFEEAKHPRAENGRFENGEREGSHDERLAAMRAYQGEGATPINRMMRGQPHGSGIAPWLLERTINRVSAAFNDSRLSGTTKAGEVHWRGMVVPGRAFAKLESLKVGKIVADRAFLSTSTSQNISAQFLEPWRRATDGERLPGKGNVMLKLTAEKGITYVRPRGAGFSEREHLFKGSTRIRITKIGTYGGENGGLLIEGRLLKR